eukprot:TRINITY_DN1706_c0_g1_i1.p1 TRINITY_DN1706_c0_g1~~TRINITY_DN1706_c0_g1_i1.p1  ORF type:complete len:557 (-),score=102.64 TRINITY_DN1706_c0_g1_i1:59-1729(-)
MKGFLPLFILAFLPIEYLYAKNSHLGPQVDQGVFVITHIQSCRKGSGYCILGFSCEIDNDFEPDDLGGHCRGLSAAFNPVASFVCCKEKPSVHELKEAIQALNNGELVKLNYSSTTSTTTTSQPSTSSVSTPTSTMPEVTTTPLTTTTSEAVQSTTSVMTEELEEDMTISVVNTKLDFETDSTAPSIITSTENGSMLLSEETTIQIVEMEEDEPPKEDSSTTMTNPTSTTSSTTTDANNSSSSSTEAPLERRLVSNDKCGSLGGQAVIQAFGRAAANLLPDLVASWVTGKTSSVGSSSRRGVNDKDEAKVTSTVIYCWLAAVIEVETQKLICTGTLVQRDVVITTASCAHKINTNGIDKYKVVAGDSNLMINLPFGVQERSIRRAVAHPTFGLLTKENDIGVIQFDSQMDLTETVCLLCLPGYKETYTMDISNCTITGYGRSIRNEIPTEITDGILRTKKLSVLKREACNRDTSHEAQNSYRSLEGTICLGEERNPETLTKDTCFIALDTGSPLFCQEKDGSFALSGILSSGTTCSRDQSIFVDVSQYLNWIVNLL